MFRDFHTIPTSTLTILKIFLVYATGRPLLTLVSTIYQLSAKGLVYDLFYTVTYSFLTYEQNEARNFFGPFGVAVAE